MLARGDSGLPSNLYFRFLADCLTNRWEENLQSTVEKTQIKLELANYKFQNLSAVGGTQPSQTVTTTANGPSLLMPQHITECLPC